MYENKCGNNSSGDCSQSQQHGIEPGKTVAVKPSLLETFEKLRKRRQALGKHSRKRRKQDIVNEICSKVLSEIPESSVCDDETPEMPCKSQKVADSARNTKQRDDEANKRVGLLKLSEIAKSDDVIIADKYDPHHTFKTKLERDLDEAIEMKDFAKAEKLSEEIAKQKLVKKVVRTVEVQQYLDKTAAKGAKKRKKKLTWNFEPKRSWETKGNM